MLPSQAGQHAGLVTHNNRYNHEVTRMCRRDATGIGDQCEQKDSEQSSFPVCLNKYRVDRVDVALEMEQWAE